MNFSNSLSVIFNDGVQDKIEKALESLEDHDDLTAGDIIEGHSETAGPSRAKSINNNKPEVTAKTPMKSTVFDDFEDSPIKIAAVKDSQELEMSLHIDPAVHCTRYSSIIGVSSTCSVPGCEFESLSRRQTKERVCLSVSPLTTPT